MAPNSHRSYTGRNVAAVTIIVGLIGAAAPEVANMDLTSTAGVVAGLVAISAVVVKYLEGWQRYEARLDGVPARRAAAPAGGSTSGAATLERALVGDEENLVEEDLEEPPAPLPGEPPAAVPGELDGEIADVPFPPDDEEIEAVAAGTVVIVTH